MITFLVFILTISIVVGIHEFGHFQMARWCNVKVLKFSIGFGKPIFTSFFGKDHTAFVIGYPHIFFYLYAWIASNQASHQ